MRLFLTILFLVLSCTGVWAQQVANLIANKIEIAPNGVLIASGSVVVWLGDTQIAASKISFASNVDELNITGPIHLTDGTGTVILADQATLANNLSQGIIQSARIILSQKVQIATTQISRVNSRYSQAYNVAATSCFICKSEVPLWQIRAKRIVHDSVEKQLYFDQAHLRVRDVPIFFFPYLRLPDPSLKRATGFLVPQISTSTTLG
ncbi:MAG: LPS-assembly protein LptD, partial [Planktomarina sp.]|nr:LPS-assembly protein LptD [Planktomarina sp.]